MLTPKELEQAKSDFLGYQVLVAVEIENMSKDIELISKSTNFNYYERLDLLNQIYEKTDYQFLIFLDIVKLLDLKDQLQIDFVNVVKVFYSAFEKQKEYIKTQILINKN
jgi:hypothetical protein